MKTKQFILIFAAMFLFVFMNSQDAYCQWASQSKWVDQSDDLPGTINITPYLIAGGVVITGTIAYLLIRKNKKKKSTSYRINQPENLSTGSFYSENDSFYDKMKKASQQATLEVFTGNFNSNTQTAYYTNTGLSVGLRFKF